MIHAFIAMLAALSPSSEAVLTVPETRAEMAIYRAPDEADIERLPMHIGGRVLVRDTGYARQWPGTYFETVFTGSHIFFRIGKGDASYRIRVDGGAPLKLVKPEPGLYGISGMAHGFHKVRIDIASESQSGPSIFGGFYGDGGTVPAPFPPRRRQVEFIGNSYSVGYGNMSASRECTEQQVWETTDTSQGIAPRVAHVYGADYRVNAISGRGIVRNYDGAALPTLPEAYPYALFGKEVRYASPDWQPQVMVVSLGTNDFSTPLRREKKWKDRTALQRDYRAAYMRFILSLRAAHPQTYFIIWSTGSEETVAQARKVADRLRASGETRLAFVHIRALDLDGCHYHPGLADDAKIAEAIRQAIDASPAIWSR